MFDSVYNYLLFGQRNGRLSRSLSRNIIHEPKELRRIYNAIISLNMQTPLYLIKLSDENQRHALSVKDASMELQACLSELYDADDFSVFSYRRAYSEKEECCTATIITEDYSSLPSPVMLRVDSLACGQINKSHPLHANGLGPAEGVYPFTINIEDNRYDFQLKTAYNARNQEVLSAMAQLINQASIGIHAAFERADDRIRLVVSSDSIGTAGDLIFDFQDQKNSHGHMGLVEYFNLNYVETTPQNSHFELNGEQKESISNRITLNHSLNIDFHSPSTEVFEIGYEPDVDRILSRITQIADSYNHLIGLADEYVSNQHLSSKLVHDVGNSVLHYKNALESCGFLTDHSGQLLLDPSLSIQAVREGDMERLFSVSGFVPSLVSSLEAIIIDPMKYVDKTVVTYPDTSKPGTANSYITSTYSGMLFNYYC